MTPDKQIKVDIIANAIQVIIPRFGLIDCFTEDAAEKCWEREKGEETCNEKNMIWPDPAQK